MSILRLIQASLDGMGPHGIPATMHDSSISREMGAGSVPVIVWVGLEVDAVRSLVAGESCDIGSDVGERLQQMVDGGEIDIDREYRVTVSVTVSGSVQHVVDAPSSEAATERVEELIGDGEGLDDLWHDYTVDDVEIEDVEEA